MMFNDKVQKQEGGENSSNFQGQTVNVYSGITYKDAKEIALNVFMSNFLVLKNEAAEIAKSRAEEITENFLEKLNAKNPESFNEFKEPALQDALFVAQKEFAKSGDKDLGELLVDILVDRASNPIRNMMQIVLDESLRIAPKLTIEQLDTITLIFLLIRTKALNLRSLDEFNKRVIEDAMLFIDNLVNENSSYAYIEYLGCGYVRAGDYGDLKNNFLREYKAMFQKGFTKDEFESDVDSIEKFGNFLIPCFHNKEKFQINHIDDTDLELGLSRAGIGEDIKAKLKLINNKYVMTLDEIGSYLLSVDSRMSKVFEAWTGSFHKMELTSVGIAIAHANYRRKTGVTLDLSIWVK
jgi:hypothetical protein